MYCLYPQSELRALEQEHAVLDLYIWLAYRLPHAFRCVRVVRQWESVSMRHHQHMNFVHNFTQVAHSAQWSNVDGVADLIASSPAPFDWHELAIDQWG